MTHRPALLGAWGALATRSSEQFKKKGEAIMRTNQTTTEKTIHPMRSPALGRTKTWRRGRGGGVRGKLLGVVLTGLLVLLLWPTAV